MKNHSRVLTIAALACGLFLNAQLFAQDSTQVRQQTREKQKVQNQAESNQVQVREQNRIRNQNLPADSSGKLVRNRNQKQNQARDGQGCNFVDENGDGFNDNAPDHDADGIPNRLDPDWNRRSGNGQGQGFVDLDGDGINDNAIQGRRLRRARNGAGCCPGTQGDGSGNGSKGKKGGNGKGQG